MGNSGLIAGAFSSTSGKADTVLTTNGDVLYYNSGRQRLAIGDEGQVLTVSGSDLPSWAASSSGATTALDNLSSVAVNATIDMNINTLKNAKYLDLRVYNELTISSGETTSTQSYHLVDTEGDASTDNYNSCVGLDYGTFMIQQQASSARDITWVNDSLPGSNRFNLGGNITFASVNDTMFLIQNKANNGGATWLRLSNGDNT